MISENPKLSFIELVSAFYSEFKPTAKIEDNASVSKTAKIGKNCIVGAGALVTENKEFPDNSLILGVPAKKVGEIDGAAAEKSKQNALHYAKTAKKYPL